MYYFDYGQILYTTFYFCYHLQKIMLSVVLFTFMSLCLHCLAELRACWFPPSFHHAIYIHHSKGVHKRQKQAVESGFFCQHRIKSLSLVT
jgi:hypothetical protein